MGEPSWGRYFRSQMSVSRVNFGRNQKSVIRSTTVQVMEKKSYLILVTTKNYAVHVLEYLSPLPDPIVSHILSELCTSIGARVTERCQHPSPTAAQKLLYGLSNMNEIICINEFFI